MGEIELCSAEGGFAMATIGIVSMVSTWPSCRYEVEMRTAVMAKPKQQSMTKRFSKNRRTLNHFDRNSIADVFENELSLSRVGEPDQ